MVPDDFVTAVHAVLTAQDMDPAFRALALTLPSETYLAEFMTEVDPQAIHAARQFLRQHLARALRDDWLALYRKPR